MADDVDRAKRNTVLGGVAHVLEETVKRSFSAGVGAGTGKYVDQQLDNAYDDNNKAREAGLVVTPAVAGAVLGGWLPKRGGP